MGRKRADEANGAKRQSDAQEAGPLILRTVFIPSEHDQELRDLAARLHVSKGEIMRRAIASYLSTPEIVAA